MHSMLKHAKNILKSCFEACFEYCLRKVDNIQWILKLILSLLVAAGIYMNGHHHIQFLFHQSFISAGNIVRSEEHTSELQSRPHLVCRLLLEKKNNNLNAPDVRVEQIVRGSVP